MEKCTFSTVTQKYLDSYAGILDTMTGTMNCAKENDSISYNFIVKMIPHHQAAIRISEELLRYTTCIALQNIATEIVVTQTKETEEMRKMLCGCAGYRNDGQSLCGYRRQYGIIVTNMFSRMRSADTAPRGRYCDVQECDEIQHLPSVKSNTERSCQSSGKRY